MTSNKLFDEISALTTELNNEHTRNIDLASTAEILRLINDEDTKVPEAVRSVIPEIERAVEAVTASFKAGGRLFYFGAGTSGRLGIVDASECPPTFGVPFDMVNGIIAGGREAVFKAQEGAEDSPEKAVEEFEKNSINHPDIVCGIAASGRTPFVKGAIIEARRRSITTIFVTTSDPRVVAGYKLPIDILIAPQTGPEVIAGSTRMKSGTAQKLVLNMITTAAMIKLGKTYGNIMVDLMPTNAKLVERSKKIIMSICETDYDTASDLLSRANGHVKKAILMSLAGVSCEEADNMISQSDGFVRKALRAERNASQRS